MDIQRSKAGLSELPQRWRGESPGRRVIKLLLGLCFLAVIVKGFHYGVREQKVFFWSSDGKMQDEQSKGSQYLLGVGKADITGYYSSHSQWEWRTC